MMDIFLILAMITLMVYLFLKHEEDARIIEEYERIITEKEAHEKYLEEKHEFVRRLEKRDL